jgi:phosphopantetheine--protein transferase-like protein
VGIDLVAVSGVEDALAEHGARYLDHVYTATEQQACASTSARRRAAALAMRFAAKEAVRKVVRTDLAWTDIEVGPGSASVPDPGWDLAVSMTHPGDWAAAVVVGSTGAGEHG